MASDQDKRKLSDLRVVDIRSELDKRGIDKSGVKAVILDRLSKVLEEEGHDVESYIFEPLGKITAKPKSVSKNRNGSEQDSESEPPSGPADDVHDLSMDVDDEGAPEGEHADLDPADEESVNAAPENDEANCVEEPIETKPEETLGEKVNSDEAPPDNKSIVDEETETPTKVTPEKKLFEKKPVEKSPIIKKEVESSPVEMVTNAETAEENSNAEKGSAGTMDPPTAEKVAATVRAMKTEALESRQTAAEKMSHDVNGVDNEDSINLDIGEDEEKLLADEDDSCGPEKDSKDEGERARKSKQGKEAAAKDEDRKRSASSEENSSKMQDDQKDDKAKSGSQEQKSKDDKDKSKRNSSTAANSRNLWVSGLSSATRATDLKQVFSKHGKVIGAKVVTNARTPGARCYGYVTMATSEEASKCIQYLHRTELHGRMISVERAKGDAGPKGEGKPPPEKKRHEHKANGHTDAAKTTPASSETAEEKKSAATDEKTTEDKRKRRVEAPATASTKPRSPHRPVRQPVKAPSPGPRKPRPIAALLTFSQIREERERQRMREREREVREEERRRREMIARQREVERKNRDEAARLEREKEKLRAERERIEVERAQLLRMERERQRLERERLEREREELKRHQLRLEAARRPAKPAVVKERRDYESARGHAVPPAPAPPSGRFEAPAPRRAVKRPAQEERRTEAYVDDRKRAAPERRFEPPPTARFEEPSRLVFPSKKETRRPEFTPPPRREPSKFERPFVPADVRIVRPNHDASSRREQVSPGARIKDARFERGGNDAGARAPISGYRREERRPEPDHRPKTDMRSSGRERYTESKPSFSGSSKGEGRYTDRGGSTWHAGTGPAPSKPFMSSLPPAHRVSPWERKESTGPWARPTESSWSGSGSSAMVGSYSSSGLAAGMSSMSGGGPYSSDRFDSYKASLGQVRKY